MNLFLAQNGVVFVTCYFLEFEVFIIDVLLVFLAQNAVPNCPNSYCGPWKFKSFEIKTENLVKLLTPLFGPDAQLPNTKKKTKPVQNQRQKLSKTITKTIASFYRALIIDF